MENTNIKITPPPIYAIWAEARPDCPLVGQAGYLSEGGKRLFFADRAEAELKIHDLRNLRLNNKPAAEYRCASFPDNSFSDQDLTVEDIRTHDLKPAFDPEEYVAKWQTYGDTGGGDMVGTASFYLPSLDKTVWINCNDEGITATSADYVWNEDHSESWARYEDVLLLRADFRDTQPEQLGPWLPMVREALRYTMEQQTSHYGQTPELPPAWQALADIRQSHAPEMTGIL